MNQLSWLLYWAEVSGRVGFAAGGIAVLAGMIAVFAGVATIVFSAMSQSEDEFDHPPAGVLSSVRGVATAALLVCIVGSLASWFAPSKQTLMLIAASEVGETVLASKDVQEIGGEAGALATDSLKLLRKYVTEQLGEEGK